MISQQANYAKVKGEDHGELGAAHDDSSTDAGESLMGHHIRVKSWEELRHTPRPRHSHWKQCCSSTLLQGLVNIVLLVLVLALLLDRRWHQERHGQLEGTGDMTGFIPPVGLQIKTFIPDMAFEPGNASDFFTDAVQKKWLSIVPSKPTLVGLTRAPVVGLKLWQL